jgi:hypothetical protein
VLGLRDLAFSCSAEAVPRFYLDVEDHYDIIDDTGVDVSCVADAQLGAVRSTKEYHITQQEC